MKLHHLAACLLAGLFTLTPAPASAKAPPKASEIKDIKAYCLDFNWAAAGRKPKPFAAPGQWKTSDPAQHVAWYQAIGANVIQTFCVSNNGYAWYKNGFVPLEKFMATPVAALKGDDRNISVLARAYHGASLDAVWNGKDGFSEPAQ